MPQIIIKERMDRTGLVKLTVGAIYRELPRNKEISVSKSELEVLMHSHEANHIFVLPEPASLVDEEINDGSIDRTERLDLDQRGNEESSRQGSEFGGASPRT